MAPWQLLEHTADLAIQGSGPTPAAALEAVLDGLLAQISDPSRVQPTETMACDLRGLDRDECVVSVLGEVLYWINVKGWVFAAVQVDWNGGEGARVLAWGEQRDPHLHGFELEVKAATYHDLQLQQEPDGRWHLRVVFDV